MRFAQGQVNRAVDDDLAIELGAVLVEDKIGSQDDATAPGEIHPPRAGEIGGMGKRAQEREQQTGDAVVLHWGFRRRIGFRARTSGPPQQNEDRSFMQRGFRRDFFPLGLSVLTCQTVGQLFGPIGPLFWPVSPDND
jgi:hypothetical protein